MEETNKDILIKQYEDISKKCSWEKRVQILAIIIDIKNDNIELRNINNSLYLDVKHFISSYLRCKRLKDFGYEDYDKELLKEFIQHSNFKTEEEYKLLVYCEYMLKSLCYDYKWIENLIKDAKLRLAKQENLLKYLILLSSKNTWTIILSILLMFIIECLILLPAPFECCEWYDFNKEFFTKNEVLNHIINVLTLHFDCIENGAKIKFSTQGVVCLVLWSFIYIIMCINFLFKDLFSNLKVNDDVD